MAANDCDIAILVVTHGELGRHFLEAAELIYQNPIPKTAALGVTADYDRKKVESKARKTIERLGKKSKRIIVLCDTNGATASRLISEQQYDDLEIRCVYGVNLPMLLDCINCRHKCDELDELAERICVAGRQAICSDVCSSANGN